MEKIKQPEDFPEKFWALVEIPMGTNVKYEYKKELNALVLDRILYGPLKFPTNYGLIPETLEEDGDEVDVLIYSSAPLHPGVLVLAKPVGVLKMVDEKGKDWKILAVPLKDPVWNFVNNYKDIPEFALDEIEFFFRRYKELEGGKWTKIIGWGNKDEAVEYLKETRKRFLEVR